MPPIEVRHRLRIAREYAGLDQKQLADLIGISRTSVGNAETGVVRPRRITLNAWALACGVPVSWLTDGVSKGPDDGPESRLGELNPRPIHYLHRKTASIAALSPRRGRQQPRQLQHAS